MNKKETKLCQNCKSSFVIEAEDIVFYKKVNVPAPTFCPQCRLKRRMMFRNEMILYKRTCNATGEEVFSAYSQDGPTTVYKREVWYSDTFNPMDYGRDYDFSRPFFDQYKELFQEVPKFSRSVLNLVNSEYSNNASDLKDCYLLFNSELSENCAYGDGITSSKNVFDSYYVKDSEYCYECFMCIKSRNVFFSSNINNSHDIYFSRDLAGCSFCFGCVNLKNKSYYIFNKPYSKEEYRKRIQEFQITSRKNREKLIEKAKQFWLAHPVKFMHGYGNMDVSGDYITNSKNTHESFLVDGFEDCKFCFSMGLRQTKSCYDFCWGGASEFTYEAVAVGYQISQARFIYECWPGCFDITYCSYCSGVSNLFGCVGLRKKQYCILNKQYSKEDYTRLVKKIIKHMNDMPYKDDRGNVYRYGEFFPPEISPFAYNETIAQEYFPLSKEQAGKQAYRWKEQEEKSYKPSLKANALPDSMRETKESIVEEIIECQDKGDCNHNCTSAFKITPQELAFYKEQDIPLPRFCFYCRHARRVTQRNPIRTWKRNCDCKGKESENAIYANTTSHEHGANSCKNEFETTYAPDNQSIVYCAPCYQKEII